MFCLSRALARCSTGMAPRRLAAASPWIGNDCIAPNQEARPPPTPWSGREPFSEMKHMKLTAISMNLMLNYNIFYNNTRTANFSCYVTQKF